MQLQFSFIDQKKDGGPDYEVEGGILSQALESKEHSGRVRGVGGVINPSIYFHHVSHSLSNSDLFKQHEMELIAQRKRNIEQDERIRRLEELILKKDGQKIESEELGSCSVKIQRSMHDEIPFDQECSGVKLAHDDNDIKIIDAKMGLSNDDCLKVMYIKFYMVPFVILIAFMW